jgi:hypothetical protein
VRFGVLNTDYDLWLGAWHYEKTAQFIGMLRENPKFNEFFGNWALPFFVGLVLVYWGTNEDDTGIPLQFLTLPFAYLPFSILGAILMNAQFRPEFLWVHPLVILPFGYLYVAFWTILIWFFEKIRILN